MKEFCICHRADGVFWRSGDRERQITERQATRLMALLWSSGKWHVESITVMRRDTGNAVSNWKRD